MTNMDSLSSDALPHLWICLVAVSGTSLQNFTFLNSHLLDDRSKSTPEVNQAMLSVADNVNKWVHDKS